MRRKLLETAMIGGGVALTLALAAWAPGQTAPSATATAKKGAATAPANSAAAPLARFVARDGLVALVEFSGVDANAEAWRGSAAYKILNQTTTGAMLEDLIAQVVNAAQESAPKPASNGPQAGFPGADPGANPAAPAAAAPAKGKIAGVDAVAVLEHAARHGAIAAVNARPGADGKIQAARVLVLRGAARKDARPMTGKLLAGLTAGQTQQPVAKSNRRIVQVKPTATAGATEGWAWWTEQDDLVLVPSIADVDSVLATLEGKQPNAVDHPGRVALAAAEGGFQPVVHGFIDPTGTTAQAANLFNQWGLKRVEFRYGLEGPALKGVFNLVAPTPRKFPVALLDQPAFDLKALPPIPANAESFGVIGLSAQTIHDQVVAFIKQADPQMAAQMTAMVDELQKRIRSKLREDVLGQLGTRLVYYVTPTPTTGKPGVVGALAKATAKATALLTVPKITLLWEVKDPVEFGKALDALVVYANQEMEAAYLQKTLPAEPAADAPRKDKDEYEHKKTRAKNLAPRLLLVTPTPKTFNLRLPAAQAAASNLNLTIALGKSHLIVATAPDAVRDALALEAKPDGRWTPTAEQTESLRQLPPGLVALQVQDPRSTLPEALANLPATLPAFTAALQGQTSRGANTAQANASQPGSDPNVPGAIAPGPIDNRRGSGSLDGGSSGLNGPASLDPATNSGVSTSSVLGGSGSGGQAAAAPGATTKPAKAAVKPPKPDEIRPLLFPGFTAVTVDAQGVRATTRSAFPDLGAFAAGVEASQLLSFVEQIVGGGPPPAHPAPGNSPPGDSAPGAIPAP